MNHDKATKMFSGPDASRQKSERTTVVHALARHINNHPAPCDFRRPLDTFTLGLLFGWSSYFAGHLLAWAWNVFEVWGATIQ